MPNIHNLDRIFKAKRIALIGASPNPQSLGGKVLANLVGGGFRGVVYPVNPTKEAVLGIACYPDIKSTPKTPDLAVICVSASQVPGVVRQCGEAGILGLIIISAGFREAGPEGRALEEQVREERQRFKGMRIIGPNCLGVIVPGLGLNATFALGMPKAGNVGFISQSGALCSSVLDWALEEKVGFSYFVSVGNTLDVDFADLIDYFGEDEQTRSIILYIESISRARAFMTASRAFARNMPIVAYKAGRYPESAQAAHSHTGALAGEDAVCQAAFQRAGIARAHDIGEIFDVVDLVGRRKIPQGPRLGVVTNAGGPGVMATDALIEANGVLAKLSGESLQELNKDLPPFWSHGNPVDVLGDARAERFVKGMEIVLKDPGVDAVLAIVTPQAMTDPTEIAKGVAQLAAGSAKPILAAWLGGVSMREGIRLLNEAGVATYATPEQGVRAFMTLVDYSRNLEALYETPKEIPVHFTLDRKKLRSEFEALASSQGMVFSEAASKALLEAYGIPVARVREARTVEEAVRAAEEIGFPVVLKILSPDITHKTEVDGVALGLEDSAAVRMAFERITQTAREKRPQAKIEGVTVQPMVRDRNALEMILGAKKDFTFGTVIMAGLGGTAAEIFGDRALGLPPLNERLARMMLESLKTWPLIQGYRGKPGANLERLLEVLIRLSYLVADFPEIAELDINPLLVTPRDVVALDARVILDPGTVGKPAKPYSHLALRPYPEEYVRKVELEGVPLTLRPIKPEDEPLWLHLLGSCSPDTLYARFRSFFRWNAHEVATRYCFNDYDREIGIVVEQEDKGVRQFLGVGRLIADPGSATAEYAVLIRDDWQNRGLGGLLTDYCLEIARKWGLKRIVASTSSDNHRMIAVFSKRAFQVVRDPTSDTVDVAKDL